MLTLSAETLLPILLWVLGTLAVQFLLVTGLGAALQLHKNQRNRLRIRCFTRWEAGLIQYLYHGGGPKPFQGLSTKDRHHFIAFLLKSLGTMGGKEGDRIRELYRDLGLWAQLKERLQARRPSVRAMAALEVGSFNMDAHYPRLVTLLADSTPRVAHAAARSLAASQRLNYAGPVLMWALRESSFQKERVLWVLQGFGEEFLPWLETRLRAYPTPPAQENMIFALLAASLRDVRNTGRLQIMLKGDDPEVQAAALKALGALGNPESLSSVLPFGHHPSWVLRAQAAKAVGNLTGPAGLPFLLDLLCDAVFEVRRNAAQALLQHGSGGREALRWVSLDACADPFARDLALERLQWLPERRPS